MPKLKKTKATAAIVNFVLSIVFWVSLVTGYVGFGGGSWIMVLAISNSAFGAGLGFAILCKYGLSRAGRRIRTKIRNWQQKRTLDPDLQEELELIRRSQ